MTATEEVYRRAGLFRCSVCRCHTAHAIGLSGPLGSISTCPGCLYEAMREVGVSPPVGSTIESVRKVNRPQEDTDRTIQTFKGIVDLPGWLRDEAECAEMDGCDTEARNLRAAADEIERLRNEVADLRSFGDMVRG